MDPAHKDKLNQLVIESEVKEIPFADLVAAGISVFNSAAALRPPNICSLLYLPESRELCFCASFCIYEVNDCANTLYEE